MTNKISLLSFFLSLNISFLLIYVPVGLLGFAIKTILVLLVTHESIFSTEEVKLFSGA